MTVAELIEHLKTLPPHLDVVATDASEAMCIVRAEDIRIARHVDYTLTVWDSDLAKWVDLPCAMVIL